MISARFVSLKAYRTQSHHSSGLCFVSSEVGRSLGSRLKRPEVVNLKLWLLLLNKVFCSEINLASIF